MFVCFSLFWWWFYLSAEGQVHTERVGRRCHGREPSVSGVDRCSRMERVGGQGQVWSHPSARVSVAHSTGRQSHRHLLRHGSWAAHSAHPVCFSLPLRTQQTGGSGHDLPLEGVTDGGIQSPQGCHHSGSRYQPSTRAPPPGLRLCKDVAKLGFSWFLTVEVTTWSRW